MVQLDPTRVAVEHVVLIDVIETRVVDDAEDMKCKMHFIGVVDVAELCF